MTLESLRSRLAALEHERQRTLDNANAYNGAIQETLRWIKEAEGGNGEAEPAALRLSELNAERTSD